MNKRQILKTMTTFEKALYNRTGEPLLIVETLTKENIKVRAMSIANTLHPEWGTFGVYERIQHNDGCEHFEIGHGSSGRVLDVAEFSQWVIVKSFFD